jgi:site-specific recombinase XerD
MTTVAATVQAFFTERLISQRRASPHTIAAYRDAIRMLLTFAAGRAAKPLSHLDFADLNASVVAAFLDHLEHDRGNSIRSRNARLAAIHSLFTFAALSHPEHNDDIARVLAIPTKRTEHRIIDFLTDSEVRQLLDQPDRATLTGRRDHTMLYLAIQTGLRASELTALRCRDIHLGTGPHVSCTGKGRKRRITPLTTDTVNLLRVWMAELGGGPDDVLFPTNRGGALSHDALAQRLTHYAARCSLLAGRTTTPHVLRHTTAMRLLHAGVDITVIALWLGHENVATTQIYLRADLELKQRALDRTTPTGTRPGRYKPTDRLLAFLEAL